MDQPEACICFIQGNTSQCCQANGPTRGLHLLYTGQHITMLPSEWTNQRPAFALYRATHHNAAKRMDQPEACICFIQGNTSQCCPANGPTTGLHLLYTGQHITMLPSEWTNHRPAFALYRA